MILFALLSPLALSACGTPYVDSRREAGEINTVGSSTLDRVAICYNAASTEPGDILKLANDQCARTGRLAQYIGQNRLQCSLLHPHRAFFDCVGARQAVYDTEADALRAFTRQRLDEEERLRAAERDANAGTEGVNMGDLPADTSTLSQFKAKPQQNTAPILAPSGSGQSNEGQFNRGQYNKGQYNKGQGIYPEGQYPSFPKL